MRKQIPVLGAMAAVAFNAQSNYANETPFYLGEFCWQARNNSLGEPESATLKLDVLSCGENHFPRSGLFCFAK